MLFQLLFFASSFIGCFYLVPIFIRIANKFSIYDCPDIRKQHLHKTPFLGGLAIVMSFFISLGLVFPVSFVRPAYSNVLYITLFLIFLIGLGDDIFNYSAKKKLFFQLLLSGMLIYKGGFQLPIEELFPDLQLAPVVGFCIALILITMVINAINLIDGADGIAASFALIATLFYSYIFYIGGEAFYCSMALTLSGGLSAFLLFNRPPAYIFMGDAGSLFVGMALSIFSFHFIEQGKSFTAFTLSSRVILSFSLLSIPIMDMIRLFFTRMLNGKSPFYADNNHIHHLMKQLGFTPKQITLLLFIFQLLIVGLAALSMDKSWIGFLLISICIYVLVIQIIRQLITYKNKNIATSVNKSNSHQDTYTEHKIAYLAEK